MARVASFSSPTMKSIAAATFSCVRGPGGIFRDSRICTSSGRQSGPRTAATSLGVGRYAGSGAWDTSERADVAMRSTDSAVLWAATSASRATSAAASSTATLPNGATATSS